RVPLRNGRRDRDEYERSVRCDYREHGGGFANSAAGGAGHNRASGAVPVSAAGRDPRRDLSWASIRPAHDRRRLRADLPGRPERVGGVRNHQAADRQLAFARLDRSVIRTVRHRPRRIGSDPTPPWGRTVLPRTGVGPVTWRAMQAVVVRRMPW